jgi:hypothetical protein
VPLARGVAAHRTRSNNSANVSTGRVTLKDRYSVRCPVFNIAGFYSGPGQHFLPYEALVHVTLGNIACVMIANLVLEFAGLLVQLVDQAVDRRVHVFANLFRVEIDSS